MAWLVRDTTVLASLEIADTFRSRLRGLLGRNGLDGALLLRPARSVHTFGMRFPIDVAHCDGDLRVLHVTSMRPNRVGRPVRHGCVVIEAEAGTFAAWDLRVGDELAVHGEDEFTPRRPARRAGPPSSGRSHRFRPPVPFRRPGAPSSSQPSDAARSTLPSGRAAAPAAPASRRSPVRSPVHPPTTRPVVPA